MIVFEDVKRRAVSAPYCVLVVVVAAMSDSGDDWAMMNTSEVGEMFGQQACLEDADDASSVASDVDDVGSGNAQPQPASFPAKEYVTFEDLRGAVLAFSRLSHGQIGDNSRCAKTVEGLPTKWLKNMFPEVRGSVKYSGFFYCTCMQPSNCEYNVPYKLLQNKSWSVLPSAVWSHNHEVSMLDPNAPSASGLVHLKTINQLSVEHKQAIILYLDAGLTVKVIRFRFRTKFIGFELRARCCKTVKEAYLRDKYGADRNQMSKFMQQLSHDCNPSVGGVFDIIYCENMEIAEIYFQMPLLRKIGEYFGKFSVIDTSHNISMSERQLATFNVRILVLEYTQTFVTILRFTVVVVVFEYTQTFVRILRFNAVVVVLSILKRCRRL